jgi:hypothetical protein
MDWVLRWAKQALIHRRVHYCLLAAAPSGNAEPRWPLARYRRRLYDDTSSIGTRRPAVKSVASQKSPY